MTDSELITEPVPLAAMKAIGVTSIRLDANWDWVQYAGRKTFDWSMLDRVVRSIRAARMSPDLIIDGCPEWAAAAGTGGDVSPTPASAAQFGTWAADVARRYAPEGVRPRGPAYWTPQVRQIGRSVGIFQVYPRQQ
jgi:hypothetical protein